MKTAIEQAFRANRLLSPQRFFVMEHDAPPPAIGLHIRDFGAILCGICAGRQSKSNYESFRKALRTL